RLALARSIAGCAPLVSQKLLQRLPGFILPRGVGSQWAKFAACHFEKLAIIGHVLFRDRLGSGISALLSDARVIADAVQTNFQVRITSRAAFRAAWRARTFVLHSSFPDMIY